MIQCIICEDWFHSRVSVRGFMFPAPNLICIFSPLLSVVKQHLGCAVVEPEELQEMICEACMNKAPFLWTYAAHFAGTNLPWVEI